VTAKQLMLSLTALPFRTFGNPAKGGSDFYQSWDGQFFLKTVRMEPKTVILVTENTWEKHFFFKDRPGADWGKDYKYEYWTQAERDGGGDRDMPKQFRGGFVDYHKEMLKRAAEGKQSLLPKFFGLIGLQVLAIHQWKSV